MGELLRKKLKDKTTAANKTKSKLVKMTGRLISEAIRREQKAIRREQEAERLVAKVKLRNKVEQAKDSREVSTLAGGLLGREKTRNPKNSEGSALSSTLNMVKRGREDLRKTNNNSDENLPNLLDEKNGLEKGMTGQKVLEERRVYFR